MGLLLLAMLTKFFSSFSPCHLLGDDLDFPYEKENELEEVPHITGG